MSVVVIDLSHRTSPVALRERFAFVEARIPEALQQLRTSGLADEAVIAAPYHRATRGRGGLGSSARCLPTPAWP